LDNWMIAVEWVGSSKVRFQDSASSKSRYPCEWKKHTERSFVCIYTDALL
jgi:hypothetical protein